MSGGAAIRVVVLDCDGVILESVNTKTEAFVRLAEDCGPDAADRLIDYHLAHGGLSRYEKFAWFFREVLGREITEKESAEWGRRFTRLCYESVLAVPFVPGAWEFISSTHRQTPLYVASGTPDDELNMIFRDRDLSGYFRGIHGTPPGKDKLLARIVREAGVPPERTLMVGDSSTDLEAAETVGTLFYGRGAVFAGSGWPWGEDLSRLSEYLAQATDRTFTSPRDSVSRC